MHDANANHGHVLIAESKQGSKKGGGGGRLGEKKAGLILASHYRQRVIHHRPVQQQQRDCLFWLHAQKSPQQPRSTTSANNQGIGPGINKQTVKPQLGIPAGSHHTIAQQVAYLHQHSHLQLALRLGRRLVEEALDVNEESDRPKKGQQQQTALSQRVRMTVR